MVARQGSDLSHRAMMKTGKDAAHKTLRTEPSIFECCVQYSYVDDKDEASSARSRGNDLLFHTWLSCGNKLSMFKEKSGYL